MKKPGRPPNKNGTFSPITGSVKPSVKKALTKTAKRLGLSRNELLRRVIEVGLAYYTKEDTR